MLCAASWQRVSLSFTKVLCWDFYSFAHHSLGCSSEAERFLAKPEKQLENCMLGDGGGAETLDGWSQLSIPSSQAGLGWSPFSGPEAAGDHRDEGQLRVSGGVSLSRSVMRPSGQQGAAWASDRSLILSPPTHDPLLPGASNSRAQGGHQ